MKRINILYCLPNQKTLGRHLCCIFLSFLFSIVVSQAQSFDIQLDNAPLQQLLNVLRQKTGYDYILTHHSLAFKKPVSIRMRNAKLTEVLDVCFKDQPLTYAIQEKTIIVSARKKKDPTLFQRVMQGTLIDSSGQVIPGATIRIKGTTIFQKSDSNGFFHFSSFPSEAILLVSSVGYKNLEIQHPKLGMLIQLEAQHIALDEVTISTGMFQRKKDSFTGATSTFSGEQLKQIGGNNVLQALKSLDPSFQIIDNNVAGSNPSQMPKIELRGRTSISTTNAVSTNSLGDQFNNDPNQPLFILDGMEASLRQIIDLDVNRIASITLLKDAASTALYGSKAANGVIVVETIIPKSGELRVFYSANSILEVPDLSGYNMLNAAEFLEFQKRSGLYSYGRYGAAGFPNENLYNERLKEVHRGVDTYWLNVPLRNTLNVGHTIAVSGGDEKLTYTVGGNYKSLQGVMKGSQRANWAGNVDLNYRRKNIIVRNSTSIFGANSDESPYGNFADYVKLSPFYRKYDESGELNTAKYLEEYRLSNPSVGSIPALLRVPNPLYNATLNSQNKSKTFDVQNNFNFQWDVHPSLRFRSGLQLLKSSTRIVNYKPALHSDFDNSSPFEKGSYALSNQERFSYNLYFDMGFNKVFSNKQLITTNVRASASNTELSHLTTNLLGFPAGVEPIAKFASQFDPYTKPLGGRSVARTQGILASLNYSFDGRYMMDATFNYDGSNNFGSKQVYAPFWSFGLGWNIHNEQFLKNKPFINLLRLRANIGSNGNQNLGQFVSNSTYAFASGSGTFGQFLSLEELGNPNLDWQKTIQYSVGFDASFFNRHINLTLNAYNKRTQPLIVPINMPSSTGLSDYFTNVGTLESKGIETSIQVNILNNEQKMLLWNIGLQSVFNWSRYSNFENYLDQFNKEALASNAFTRYYDGSSPDDLWAVRSLGIDPASGEEVFLSKNNLYTNVYNTEDIVKVGTARPLSEGVISSNLSYKRFKLNLYLRYKMGASFFNEALYNKVENISFESLQYNQDRRALYDRWQQPGDRTPFKAISIFEFTPMSSRFIQKENLLSGESLSVSYDFVKKEQPWLTKVYLSNLRIMLVTSNVFRLSNIQIERGINYPFSRSYSINLSASF